MTAKHIFWTRDEWNALYAEWKNRIADFDNRTAFQFVLWNEIQEKVLPSNRHRNFTVQPRASVNASDCTQRCREWYDKDPVKVDKSEVKLPSGSKKEPKPVEAPLAKMGSNEELAAFHADPSLPQDLKDQLRKPKKPVNINPATGKRRYTPRKKLEQHSPPASPPATVPPPPLSVPTPSPQFEPLLQKTPPKPPTVDFASVLQMEIDRRISEALESATVELRVTLYEQTEKMRHMASILQQALTLINVKTPGASTELLVQLKEGPSRKKPRILVVGLPISQETFLLNKIAKYVDVIFIRNEDQNFNRSYLENRSFVEVCYVMIDIMSHSQMENCRAVFKDRCRYLSGSNSVLVREILQRFVLGTQSA